jgi:hypothetical protein
MASPLGAALPPPDRRTKAFAELAESFLSTFDSGVAKKVPGRLGFSLKLSFPATQALSFSCSGAHAESLMRL